MNTQELVERIKGNPRTTWLAVVAGAMYAGGDYLHGNAIEPWGALLLGAAGIVGGLGLLLARDGKQPPPEGPPQ